MQYVVVCAQIIGGGTSPFQTVYNCDGKKFDERDAAIKHGFAVRGSDDFNIGVLDGRQLVSLDWMNEPVDTDPDILAEVSAQLPL